MEADIQVHVNTYHTPQTYKYEQQPQKNIKLKITPIPKNSLETLHIHTFYYENKTFLTILHLTTLEIQIQTLQLKVFIQHS